MIPNTGLFNTRFMELELQRQVEKWVEDIPFVIVLLDINRFKDVNGTYGHLMGDQVILTLANALNECAQQNNG